MTLSDIYVAGLSITLVGSAILILIEHLKKGLFGRNEFFNYIGELMAALVISATWFLSIPVIIANTWRETK